MIATQTQPNLNGFSWDCHDGLAVFKCRADGSPIQSVSLAFSDLAEVEAFATAAAQMAQDYRLSKGAAAGVASPYAESRRQQPGFDGRGNTLPSLADCPEPAPNPQPIPVDIPF